MGWPLQPGTSALGAQGTDPQFPPIAATRGFYAGYPGALYLMVSGGTIAQSEQSESGYLGMSRPGG